MAEQRYHVLERIDAGGMAEVFKANASSIKGYEKLVAIKRILPDLTKDGRFVRMFLDEAKVSLHLSHTNCVQVFDLGQADKTYFIVMEYVDGVNLKFVIEKFQQKQKKIKVEHATYMAIEVCKGLAHAHEKRDQSGNHLGIVHRDVSPPNVLISREGEVKLTDFGLAKAKDQVETTDPGVVKGKFGYLSPEAAFGKDVDHRTDIFALGILLWEMLSGVRLFRGKTDLETLQQVRTNQYRSLSEFRTDVPPPLENIIRKMLANVDERYPNVRSAVKELSTFLFAYGIPVTSFDIAAMTAQVGARRKTMAASSKDRAIEEAVQQAVNRIVSLEEIEDLDTHLAEVYSDLPDAGQDIRTTGAFEDPRLWADVGFEDVSLGKASEAAESVSEDRWSKRNLADFSENPAPVAVSDVDETIQMSAKTHLLKGNAPKQEGRAPKRVQVQDVDPTMQLNDLKRPNSPSLGLDTGLPASMGPTPSVSVKRETDVVAAAAKPSGLPILLIIAIFSLILSVLGVLYVTFFR